MPVKHFGFSIPSLPKPVYEVMRDLCKRADVSQWHTVIMGVILLAELEQSEPARVQALAERVKATY